jgi:hypothetical protein
MSVESGCHICHSQPWAYWRAIGMTSNVHQATLGCRYSIVACTFAVWP